MISALKTPLCGRTRPTLHLAVYDPKKSDVTNCDVFICDDKMQVISRSPLLQPGSEFHGNYTIPNKLFFGDNWENNRSQVSSYTYKSAAEKSNISEGQHFAATLMAGAACGVLVGAYINHALGHPPSAEAFSRSLLTGLTLGLIVFVTQEMRWSTLHMRTLETAGQIESVYHAHDLWVRSAHENLEGVFNLERKRQASKLGAPATKAYFELTDLVTQQSADKGQKLSDHRRMLERRAIDKKLKLKDV